MHRDITAHFDQVAQSDRFARRVQSGFHHILRRIIRHHVQPQRAVLECGCARGELLRGVEPGVGVGIDLSEAMLSQARASEPHNAAIRYLQADIQEGSPAGQFDYILWDFLAGHLQDTQVALERLHRSAGPRTRLVITSLNTLWLPVLKLGQACGFTVRHPDVNWLAESDLVNLLELSGWEVVTTKTEILLPFRVPLLNAIFNRCLVRLPGVRHLGSTLMIIARPKRSIEPKNNITCTVVVPARNEAGNIRPALERIAPMGAWTEVIFVEGNSTDDTWATIEREVAAYRGPLRVRAIKQPGKGKWDAVRAGFAIATGDVLVIQDADLTAPPEDLPKFFAAICDGTAEFANGSRLVYPMEKQAMRFLNLLGNKFFALSLSYVLGQSIKDSLCGTKMLLKSDYERIMERIKSLGDFDPFGDFNLLFGAALLNLKIRDIPVRYKDRTYGETNISRFKHGWLLLKMTAFGLWHIRWL